MLADGQTANCVNKLHKLRWPYQSDTSSYIDSFQTGAHIAFIVKTRGKISLANVIILLFH